jgi:cell division protease FtsH
LLEREVLDANEIRLIIEGKELPKMTPPPKGDDGVQQVLKPEPGRPGLAKGERPAPA